MLKPERVTAIADRADLSKAQAGQLLNTILEEITLALANNDSVTLVGFGSFVPGQRGAHMGKNPQTGQPLMIKASHTVAFKLGKKFKETVAQAHGFL